MNKLFKMTLTVLVTLTLLFPILVESKELVINPTYKDLEGKWEGTAHKDKTRGKDITSSATATFSLNEKGKMGLTIIRGEGRTGFKNITISGDSINASNNLRTVTFKLYRADSKKILIGEYTITGSKMMTMSTKAFSGSYYFEYIGK
jgi:hypothetical protein